MIIFQYKILLFIIKNLLIEYFTKISIKGWLIKPFYPEISEN